MAGVLTAEVKEVFSSPNEPRDLNVGIKSWRPSTSSPLVLVQSQSVTLAKIVKKQAVTFNFVFSKFALKHALLGIISF